MKARRGGEEPVLQEGDALIDARQEEEGRTVGTKAASKRTSI